MVSFPYLEGKHAFEKEKEDFQLRDSIKKLSPLLINLKKVNTCSFKYTENKYQIIKRNE